MNRAFFKRSLSPEDFLSDYRLAVSEYICYLCRGIYLDPVTESCGHVFCRNCIEKSLEISRLCPITNNVIDSGNIKPSGLVRIFLDNTKMFCKQMLSGCSWIGEYCNYEKHIRLECMKLKLKCSYCSEEIKKEDLGTHMTLCNSRLINCNKCSESIRYMDISNHMNICLEEEFPCLWKCDMIYKKKALYKHMIEDCLNRESECKYQQYGCTDIILMKEEDQHYVERIKYHSELVTTFFSEYMEKLKGALESRLSKQRVYQKRIKRMLKRYHAKQRGKYNRSA
jgi:hypothetical protein